MFLRFIPYYEKNLFFKSSGIQLIPFLALKYRVIQSKLVRRMTFFYFHSLRSRLRERNP